MFVDAAYVGTISHEENEDRIAIDRVLAGDVNSFSRLVERHQKAIYRVAFAVVRNEFDADTITQDTFVQAYLRLRSFEGRSGFQTWLTRIAINRARDLLRKPKWLTFSHSHGPDSTIPDPVDDRPDPERTAISIEIEDAVERSLRNLSAQQRLIFRLRHYEDMSIEQIAEHVGLKAVTVRVHLFRAVHKVRKELAGWTGSGFTAEETLS